VSVTAPKGFVAAGVAAGVKESGDLDLALVATADGKPVPAAGIFTTNKMCAAPVSVSQGALRASAGEAVAVVINSGNANAATGQPGVDDAELMCALTASEFAADPHHVLVCSTGLIGYRLPMDAIAGAIPGLVAARSVEGAAAAADAMRTTDTVKKEAVSTRDRFTVGGMAKGAAMLAPNMATMLAVLTTDALVAPAQLKKALVEAATHSFNELTVDGATSTNDTVLMLASGLGGEVDPVRFNAAVAEVCADLAGQMASDAEGATKVVRVRVEGAHDDDEAAIGARKVAESQLVKCSWYGNDPYWGRIASELGSAGIHFDQRLLSIAYGPFMLAREGVNYDHDEDGLHDYMQGRNLDIIADLGIGAGRATIVTNDLTHAYVDENMGTS
jgi:glutamate N-acetyltransferase / amino-acid N-acetyltransferase